MQLLVLTPDAAAFRADSVHWVKMQLADGGGIGIWPGHAPLLAETVTAPLQYADETGEHSLPLNAGVLLVAPDRVTIYTAGMAVHNDMPEARAVGVATRRFTRLTEALRVRQQRTTDGRAGGDHVAPERT